MRSRLLPRNCVDESLKISRSEFLRNSTNISSKNLVVGTAAVVRAVVVEVDVACGALVVDLQNNKTILQRIHKAIVRESNAASPEQIYKCLFENYSEIIF